METFQNYSTVLGLNIDRFWKEKFICTLGREFAAVK